ncbi:MAG TPA: hypothetical protein VMT34_13705 [Aggregatilineales bacterium]|nr:hypothetical protein [Aggregatilineales bacterium]
MKRGGPSVLQDGGAKVPAAPYVPCPPGESERGRWAADAAFTFKRHEIGKAKASGTDPNEPGFVDKVTPLEISEYFEFL